MANIPKPRKRGEPVDAPPTATDANAAPCTVVERPTPGRIESLAHDGSSIVSLPHDCGITLQVGERVLVHAWPPTMRSSDVTDGIAISATEVLITHPFGPARRKVWIRRPSTGPARP